MWDSIGKETFRVFRRWLKRRANGSTTAAASASLPAPRVMQPWPTPSSNVSHPSRKSKQTVGRPLVSGDAGGVNSLAASAGGRRDYSGSVPPQGRLRQAVRFCVTFPGHVRDGEFQRPRQLLAGPVQ